MKQEYHHIEGILEFSTGYQVWFKMEQHSIRQKDLEDILKQSGEDYLP